VFSKANNTHTQPYLHATMFSRNHIFTLHKQTSVRSHLAQVLQMYVFFLVLFQMVDPFRTHCIEYARAGANLSEAPQRRELSGLLVNLCDVSFERVRAILDASVLRPLLYCYQSDATSYLCRSEIRTEAAYAKITRKGHELHEFLMERGFLVTLQPDGTRQGAVILGHPRPLLGKDGWTLFSAAVDFFPLLKERSHQSIAFSTVLAMNRYTGIVCSNMLCSTRLEA
jgi:hypothetical protein